MDNQYNCCGIIRNSLYYLWYLQIIQGFLRRTNYASQEEGEDKMSLCRLMIDDFQNNSGYRINDMRGRPKKYSRSNLLEGIEYSDNLLKEGYFTEPFLDYNLKKFIKWAKEKLILRTFKYR